MVGGRPENGKKCRYLLIIILADRQKQKSVLVEHRELADCLPLLNPEKKAD